MSAIEKSAGENLVKPRVEPVALPNFIERTLAVLSSVRFGIILLIVLVALSMTGMLVMQTEIEGFERYYNELTPSERLLYGRLGFFDIYHTWYFNLLLLVLSLNIVLASIDRFPKAWTFIARPKLDASPHWLRGQKPTATLHIAGASVQTIADGIAKAAKADGLKARVTEKGGRTYVFAERGAWNRLGAYAVHVALLLLFLGSFISNYFERSGTIRLSPGSEARAMSQTIYGAEQSRQINYALPFTIECTDIEQKLRERDKTISAGNTLDWITRIRVNDNGATREAVISLNKPFDYRGYRFFQASFIPQGSARNVTLKLTPAAGGAGQEITVPRYGDATLADGTRVAYVEFFPDFTLAGSKPQTASNDYNNPAVQLQITPPGEEPRNGYAFATQLPDGAPVGAPVGGYKLHLADFEKVPLAHILQVKHDPLYGSTIAWYVGGPLLILTLCGVFFFSHQRVWAAIEEKSEGEYDVTLGGNVNRNQIAFEDRFKRLINSINSNFPSKVQQS